MLAGVGNRRRSLLMMSALTMHCASGDITSGDGVVALALRRL
jgi:hypothetical protein